jgi:HPt (histidine-containing phosphotransfer) domain-containing protein
MYIDGQSNSGPSTGSAGASPAISIPEFQALVEMVGEDNPEVLVDLLDTYIVESSGLVGSISKALQQGDVAAMLRPAHGLKSSSASVGALLLSRLCSDLESHVRGNYKVDVPTQVNAIVHEFERVTVELEDLKAQFLNS